MIGYINDVGPTKKNKKLKKDDLIFGQNTYLKINKKQMLNNNTVVIGSSGTGKTESYVIPNLLQGNANYVVADAKGQILKDTYYSLKKMGYDIQVLNLIDLDHSMTYNPLAMLNSDSDIRRFSHDVEGVNIAKNSSGNVSPYWDNAASNLLTALILYVKAVLPKQQQTMHNVTTLFNWITESDINKIMSDLDPDNMIGTSFKVTDINSKTDAYLANLLFNGLPQKDINIKQIWNSFYRVIDANVTTGGILSTLSAALIPWQTTEMQNLTAENPQTAIDFHKLLNAKSAIFVMYDDSDKTKNFLFNTFYSQLIDFLYKQSYKQDNGQLENKVRFFLDDFKNIEIDGFDDYLATARSHNIEYSLMLQDESQLKAKFGINWSSVLGNCHNYLFTGTIDLNMAKTAAVRFNKSITEIRQLDPDQFLIDVAGRLQETKRYNYHRHPNYVKKTYNLTNVVTKADNIDYSVWFDLISKAPNVKMINLQQELEKQQQEKKQADQKQRDKEQQYAKLGSDLQQLIRNVSNVDSPQSERIKAIDKMKQILDECLTISDLNELTAVYRYTTPNTAINVGYDEQAVTKFVTDLIDKYPLIQSDK